MTADNRDEDEAAPIAATRLISVVDAVCCGYFCAAGKSSLLVRILTELGMEILIPAEVEREVLGKRRGQVQDHWSRLRNSSRVRILDELMVTDSRADVVAAVARVRGTSAHLALSTRRDLGEAVVIGHATVLAKAGHEVYVVRHRRSGWSDSREQRRTGGAHRRRSADGRGAARLGTTGQIAQHL